MHNNLRVVREKRGMSGTQLAEKIGTSPQFIYQIEKGEKNIPSKLLPKICQVLEATPNEILGIPTTLSSVKEPSEFGLPTNVLVPVLEEVSAGNPIFNEGAIVDYEVLPRQYIPQGPENFFWLIVKGDSMINAQIPDGCWVLVRMQPTVDNGDIAVVWIEDEGGTVKRVRFFDGQVLLQPESPNPKHEPRLVKREQVRIIGKVMEVKIKT